MVVKLRFLKDPFVGVFIKSPIEIGKIFPHETLIGNKIIIAGITVDLNEFIDKNIIEEIKEVIPSNIYHKYDFESGAREFFGGEIDKMNKVIKFRFIKDLCDWRLGTVLLSKGHEFMVASYDDKIQINGLSESISNLIRYNYIEEILPNKKPISSEENTNIEEDIYSKKYNIYEILTFIPNLPTNTIYKCSLDSNEWTPTFSDKSLKLTKGSERYIEEVYSLKEILEATYTIVKPVEEVKETWIEIETYKDLCSAIVNKKMIRLGDGKPSSDYNDEQIETFFGALSHGVFKIAYLEE